MWIHGNGGSGSCCSQSYMRIFASDGTLVASSASITFGNGEEGEGLYSFSPSVSLTPGTYFLLLTKGPSANTNGTWIFGSSGDAYSGGAWLDGNGVDTGEDAYFKLRRAP